MAYIELKQAEKIHEMENGPSPDKKAAALAGWINHLKPVQMPPLDQGNPQPTDTRGVFVNPLFALVVGWGMKLQLENETQPEEAAGQVLSLFPNHGLANDLVYHLTWRCPDFHNLTILFRLLFAVR